MTAVKELTTYHENSFKQGFKDALPTLFGYISIGMAFGVVGVASHLTIVEIAMLSIFVYAGSAQFIMTALLIANTPISAIILTVFIVNLRHLLMSLTVAPYFTRYSLLRNIGFGTLLTDETFGVAVTQAMKNGQLFGRWMDGLNLTAYISWILACTLGGLIGQWVPDPETWGLDFALVAMFVALLVLQLSSIEKGKVQHYLWLIGCTAVSMYVLSYFVPSHVAVLVSTMIVATIGVVTER